MQEKLNIIDKITTSYFQSVGLVYQNLIIVISGFSILKYFDIDIFINKNINYVYLVCFAIIIFLMLIISLIWYFVNYRFPASTPSKHSIIICLDVNSYSDYVYLKNILIRKFKKRIESIDDINMEVIFLQYLKSKQILKKPKMKAFSIISKHHYNIIFTGFLERGKFNNNPQVEISSNLAVVTTLLRPDIQSELSHELNHLINKYIINESNDLNDCAEITNELIIIFEYISIIASTLSGNINFALKALKTLKPSILNYKKNVPNINYVKSQIKLLELHLYELNASELYYEYLDNMNLEVKKKLDSILLEMLDNPDLLYEYHLMQGGLILTQTSNSIESRRHIDLAKRLDPNDNSWRYSKAFLDCFDGKLISSYREYIYCLNKPHYQIIWIETYINRIYELYPDKVQFEFVLGLINEIAKDEVDRAKEHYIAFIEKYKDSNQMKEIVKLIEGRLIKLQVNSQA